MVGDRHHLPALRPGTRVQLQETAQGRQQRPDHGRLRLCGHVRHGQHRGTRPGLEFDGIHLPGRPDVHVLDDHHHQGIHRPGPQEQGLFHPGIRHARGRRPDRRGPDGAAHHHRHGQPVCRRRDADGAGQTPLLPDPVVPRGHLRHPLFPEMGPEIPDRRDPAAGGHRPVFRHGHAGQFRGLLLGVGSLRNGFHPIGND